MRPGGSSKLSADSHRAGSSSSRANWSSGSRRATRHARPRPVNRASPPGSLAVFCRPVRKIKKILRERVVRRDCRQHCAAAGQPEPAVLADPSISTACRPRGAPQALCNRRRTTRSEIRHSEELAAQLRIDSGAEPATFEGWVCPFARSWAGCGHLTRVAARSWSQKGQGVVRKLQSNPAIALRSDHGEGPCWDQRTDTLLWVDQYAGLVNVAVFDDHVDGLTITRTYDAGAPVGAVVPSAKAEGWMMAC